MVDFRSGQGCNEFATAGLSTLCRKKMNGYAIIEEMRERRAGPQDAIYGWALTKGIQIALDFFKVDCITVQTIRLHASDELVENIIIPTSKTLDNLILDFKELSLPA